MSMYRIFINGKPQVITRYAGICHICATPTDTHCMSCGNNVCTECSTQEVADMSTQDEGLFCNACWDDMSSILATKIANQPILIQPYVDKSPVYTEDVELLDTIAVSTPLADSLIGVTLFYNPYHPTYICNRCIPIAPLPADVKQCPLTIAHASCIDARCGRCWSILKLSQKDLDRLTARGIVNSTRKEVVE